MSIGRNKARSGVATNFAPQYTKFLHKDTFGSGKKCSPNCGKNLPERDSFTYALRAKQGLRLIAKFVLTQELV